MSRNQIFPLILIILDIGAAFVYGSEYNWRLCGYWLFAAGLTVCVTF
jgi:hypothetical protein